MVQAALSLYDGSVFNNACHDIPWQSYRWRAPIDQPAGTRGVDKDSNRFQTLFWSNMTDGNLPGALDIHYDADIPIPLLSGDANGDGVVNGKDVEAIAQHIMGELPEGDHFSKKNADINGDEKIDATDIVQLVNRVNQ